MLPAGRRPLVWAFASLLCLHPGPWAGRLHAATRAQPGPQLAAKVALGGNLGVQAGAGATLALRAGALATTELDLVGLSLNLPGDVPQLPQDSPFYLPVSLMFGNQAATAAQQSSLVPATAALQGTLTGPGLAAPVALAGTLAQGLSVPGLPQKGDYTISNVQLVQGTPAQVILSASQPSLTVTCLGQILLTSVTSSPMTLQELTASGIQLDPGDYQGQNFNMTLSIGGEQVSLNVPVAIPWTSRSAASSRAAT